jgi:hypothetical protein
MKNLYKHILIIGLIFGMATGESIAQKTKKKTTRIQVEYIKEASNEELLVATLRIREERYVALSNVTVSFYSINDTSKVLLKKVQTNKEGKAIFVIEDNPKIFKDSLGLMTFEVEYAGNSSSQSAKRKISIKQADLEISFFQKDSLKTIDVIVHEKVSGDQSIPVNGLNISFFIQGTFSQLSFDEGKTDEEGHLRIDFPVYMPGDTSGVLTIVAKILEHDTYGTVESRGKINWGIPVPLAVEKRRGLGDTDAPLWMVYTLIILLSAVWFHYLYVIFLIIKIRLKGRSPKRKQSKQQLEVSIS